MRRRPWRCIGRRAEQGSANEDDVVCPSDDISILLPLIVAVTVTFGTIIIHALPLGAIVRFFRHERRLGHAGLWFWTDVVIVAWAALPALTAHLVEITGWAVVFAAAGEFPRPAPAFYHSAVNYTSLVYGDVVMSASWRLLGPLEKRPTECSCSACRPP
jgi:hypothetical protein